MLPFLLASAARADDSFAAVGAGSLVFRHADRIAMQREDLTLSPKEVRVRYEMRNDRGPPFTGHVAFPFPVIDFARLTMRSMIYGTDLEFLHFVLTVDGQAVTPTMRVWATVQDRDVTALLRAQGVDLQHLPNEPPAVAEPTPAQLHALQAGGAMDRTGRPLWQLHIAFEWDQEFRAGITVIEHRYKPLTGFSLAMSPVDLAPPVFDTHRVCRGGAQPAARAMLDQARQTNPQATLFLAEVAFVLRTARNWQGPIGEFHLTLDTQMAGSLAWACLPGMRLKQTSPTRYEGHARRWVANSDLEAVFVAKEPWGLP